MEAEELQNIKAENMKILLLILICMKVDNFLALFATAIYSLLPKKFRFLFILTFKKI